MELLTKEQILSASDIQTEDVPVSEWGGTVRVKALSGAERDQFEMSMFEERGKKVQRNLQNMRAKLVSLSIVDEKGSRVFTDADVKALGNKSAAALDRVFAVAMRLSGVSEQDVDELAGNFTPADGASSSST